MDMILVNGNVITMAVPNKREQAIAIDNGKIVKVAPNWAIEPMGGADTKIIDLQGRTVLPGFIDSHMHASLTGLCLNSVQLLNATSVAEVCEQINEHTKNTSPDKWVFGTLCIPWNLKEKCFPTRTELDNVSEGHPVYIASVTFHSGAANTKAFEYINIDPGLTGVDKDPLSGQPTGAFLTDESHFYAANKAYGTMTDEDIEICYQATADFAVSRGVTTIHCLDGQFLEEDRDVLILHSMQHKLPIHTLIMWQTMDVKKVLEFGLPRIGGCLTLDGTGFEHTALMYEPYADEPEVYGTLFIPEKTVESFVLEAHKAGLQVGMHTVGDRAVDILVRAYEKAQQSHPREDMRHRVEHFIMPTDWALDKAVELGLALPMQPAFPYLWDNPEASENVRLLGPERRNRLEPFQDILKRGGIISGGSDSPVTEINPLLGIHGAVNNPNSIRNVPVEEALRMFTTNGAWVGREEHLKGTIEPGKLADLVILDRDPYKEPEHIKDFRVVQTVVEGKIVYES
jgi:predicted amidohydrolase YtcJ